MESCSFHGQLLSVVELLAKAAAEEMDRRAELSCAVLRLEVSRSRRDIELLRRRCEGMEAELRRSRIRARRKVFYPPAAERLTPSVKLSLSRDRHLDRQVDAEAQGQPQCPSSSGHILIKEECAEEDTWKNHLEEKLIAEAEHQPSFEESQPVLTSCFTVRLLPDPPGSPAPPAAEAYDGFPEQELNGNQSEAEFVVKHEREEEPEGNTAAAAAPLEPACTFEVEEGDGQLWSSSQSFLYDGQQFPGISSAFPSRSSMHLGEVEPRSDSGGKSHPAVGGGRRKRTFSCRKAQQEGGHEGLGRMESMDESLVPQESQHRTGEQSDDITQQSQASSSLSMNRNSSGGGGGGGGPVVLPRKMCAPWRAGGVGEKRFSCSFCDKTFMRFSQLKEHLRSHTGEKPFSCLQCGRSFTKQCNLIRHAVVHSGEKPHQCSLCGKCFTQRSSLKSHQKTAH